uniref:Mycinamicin VIII C21 methyl hydroxylase n=2 Tax=Micromonospora griseorubida TaxID=28040 RepID=MYCCI_MICGR|nr:RecName: Full=Mycinamicin VIII C21 methyl hydroxylase; AltName: Full=Cytochrome P450 MycCI; AltName: Full=Mycinamicin biosynthesis protein CI [Micromonospora griseorubida]
MVVWPMDRTCAWALPEQYAEFRQRATLVPAKVWDGSPTWLVSRYEHVRALLVDPRVTVDPTRQPRLSEADGDGDGFRSMLMLDPPEHTRLRRMFISAFSVRQVETMRPEIEKIVDGILDRLLALEPPVDILTHLALPMSTQVICHLLGVPYEDREFFQERSELASRPNDDRSMPALIELVEYLDGLVRTKTAHPDTGLLGTAVTERLLKGEITHQELVNNAVLLLAAGHETSANQVTLSVLTLLRHPETAAELREQPELMPNAVDELLRYHSIADGLRRAATADIVLGDHTIRAGDGLIILLSSANHDGNTFGAEATFDIHRPARHHVAFGYGPHQCLGQNLARLEMEVTLGKLFRRVPALRLAQEPDALRVRQGSPIFGIDELLVEW